MVLSFGHLPCSSRPDARIALRIDFQKASGPLVSAHRSNEKLNRKKHKKYNEKRVSIKYSLVSVQDAMISGLQFCEQEVDLRRFSRSARRVEHN